MNEQYTHMWCFKEQDGSWSPWYLCTAAEAAQKEGRSDVLVEEFEELQL